ncbi:ribosome maturation factor RimM [Ravibacter arvi]|uniref:Ribosome maturation factor RimM n=1 Tax=Ravibacter arvi TaxID=2051041 RepID=A0ABP8M9G6_9BACT
MDKESCYLLGYVVKTHGLKGEISVFLDVDYPQDYDELDSVFVETKGQLIPYIVTKINIQQKGKAIVKLETIDNIDVAQTLVGSSLYLPEDVLDDLEDGGFYYHQIMGYTIVDKTLGKLGQVRTVYTPNAQDLIAMDYEGNEILIPIVDEIVDKANHESREIYVNLPEGLLEIYKNDDKSPDDAD